jgi:hypothetical protein
VFIRQLWQLKTVVFQHWCLLFPVLLGRYETGLEESECVHGITLIGVEMGSSKPVLYRPNEAAASPASKQFRGQRRETLLKGKALYG